MSGRDGRIHSKNGVESDRERAYADGYRTRRGRGHGPMGNVGYTTMCNPILSHVEDKLTRVKELQRRSWLRPNLR